MITLTCEGWERVVLSERNVFSLELDDAHYASRDKQKTYPGVGVYFSHSPQSFSLRFRMHVEPTMGGNYKAELRLGKDDIAKLFRIAFRQEEFDEVLALLNGTQDYPYAKEKRKREREANHNPFAPANPKDQTGELS